MTLQEYGAKPNEVLANYIGARDYGQPQKAYFYISSINKRKMSFSSYINKIEIDPFIVKTVSEINQRSKTQSFELISESAEQAVVNWVTQSPASFGQLPEYENDELETETQSIEFKLIKEDGFWKVVFEQYGIFEE